MVYLKIRIDSKGSESDILSLRLKVPFPFALNIINNYNIAMAAGSLSSVLAILTNNI
jgi:hypothetical protein